MKKMHLNKKGGERITYALAWFLLIVLAVGGIAASAFTFSSYKVDTRLYEAKILSKHLLSCITENGNLKDIFQEFFNLEQSCALNLKVGKFYEYHINLVLYEYESCNAGSCTNVVEKNGKNLSKDIGDQSLAGYCSIKDAKGRVPKCFEENFYILYNNEPHFLGIKIAVNKQEQNVR